MKLFKLFIIGLKKKYNGEAALCWSYFIFFLRSNSVTTSSNVSKSFSAGLINKKSEKKNKQINKLMIYLSFVKLYFSSPFNYVQFNHINLKFLPFLQHLTDDFQIGSAMRFFKNASKTQYSGRKKVILKGRALKMCVHSPLKKVAEEVQ